MEVSSEKKVRNSFLAWFGLVQSVLSITSALLFKKLTLLFAEWKEQLEKLRGGKDFLIDQLVHVL